MPEPLFELLPEPLFALLPEPLFESLPEPFALLLEPLLELPLLSLPSVFLLPVNNTIATTAIIATNRMGIIKSKGDPFLAFYSGAAFGTGLAITGLGAADTSFFAPQLEQKSAPLGSWLPQCLHNIINPP